MWWKVRGGQAQTMQFEALVLIKNKDKASGQPITTKSRSVPTLLQ